MVDFKIASNMSNMYHIVGRSDTKDLVIDLVLEEQAVVNLINALIAAGIATASQFLYKGKWLFSEETNEMLVFPIADEEFYEALA